MLYEPGTDLAAVAAAVEAITGEGKTVSAQRALPPKLRFREQCRLNQEGEVC